MYAYFNIVHILFLMLPIVLLVTFYNLFKDKSHKVQTVFLLCCVAVSATISFYDMFSLVPEFGWISTLRNLPLFPCDLNNFILPLAILRKDKKPLLNKFILYFVTTGPIYTIMAPVAGDYEYYFYDYEIWGTFLAHSLYIVVAVLYLKFNHIKCSSKGPWKVWLPMIIMLTIAHGINLALIYSGANPNANYFFTAFVPDVGIAYRSAVLLGYHIPWIRCYFFMVIGYTGMTIIYYFVHKTTETEAFARFWSVTKETLKKLLTPKEKKLEAERESNSESGFES